MTCTTNPGPSLNGDPAAWRRSRIRRGILDAIETALFVSGLSTLFRKSSDGGGAAVLMYHSVPSAVAMRVIDPENTVPPRVFAAQIRFLARRRRVKSLAEVVADIENSRKLLPGTVVLTFDDGYADTLSEAAPVLGRHGLPATLFLATRYVDFAEPNWIDRLYCAFRHRRTDSLALNGLMPGARGQCLDLSGKWERWQAYQNFKLRLIEVTWKERAALLSKLESRLQPAMSPQGTTITWDGVRQLTGRYPGFDIGAHSATHLALDRHSAQEVKQDLFECRRSIEHALGSRPRLFSYPYGRHTPAVRNAVAGCGFAAALATEPFHMVTHRSDPYGLPRLAAPRCLHRFKLRTGGVYPRLWMRLLQRA